MLFMVAIDNPIINNIIPFISKEERYNLFTILDKLMDGNYQEKAKALEIKQSAFYQYKKRELEISDSKTMLMLNLLHDKDLKKFNEFLIPIVLRAKKQVSIIEDCLSSELLDMDFNLPMRLFDIHKRYEAFQREIDQKEIELIKKRTKEFRKKHGRKVIRVNLYQRLYDELQNHDSIGESFLDDDPLTWRRDYYFWKKIASQVNFVDKVNKLTRAKRPHAHWFENLFGKLHEAIEEDENYKINQTLKEFADEAIENGLQVRDREEELKKYRDKLHT